LGAVAVRTVPPSFLEFSLAAAVFSVLCVLDIRRPLPPFAEDAEDAEDVEDGGRLKTDGGSI